MVRQRTMQKMIPPTFAKQGTPWLYWQDRYGGGEGYHWFWKNRVKVCVLVYCRRWGYFFKMCSSKDVASPLQLGFTGHLMCQWELCFPAKLWGNTPGPCGSWAARDWGHLADAGREGSEEARGVARLQF